MRYVDTQVRKYTIPGKDYFLLRGGFEILLANLIVLSVTFSSCAILFPSRPMANTNFRDYMQLQPPIEGKVKMILR